MARAVEAKAEIGAKKLQKVLRMTRIGKNLAVISNYTNSNLICRSLDTQHQHPRSATPLWSYQKSSLSSVNTVTEKYEELIVSNQIVAIRTCREIANPRKDSPTQVQIVGPT